MACTFVEHIAREIEVLRGPSCADGRRRRGVSSEQQAVPFTQRVALQVQAGVVREVWRAEQLALVG